VIKLLSFASGYKGETNGASVMTNRFLGNEGESAFYGWCNNAGFTCNPSIDDQFGWDFIVEFPTEKSANYSMDSQPSPVECKAQVKSSEGSKKSTQITVSALYRLVQYCNPAFVCFIKYGDNHAPESAYLVHIDDEISTRVLAKVRALEKKGRSDKLHKSKLTIKYSNQYKIRSLDGDGIREAIQQYLPDGMNNYVVNKQNKITSLGEPGFRLRTQFNHQDVESLVDLSLGLKENMKMDGIAAHTTRFGIDLPDANLTTAETVVLSMPNLKPTFPAKIVFKKEPYTPGVEVEAGLFLPPSGVAMNKTKPIKARVVSELLSLIIEGEIVDITVNWDTGVSRSLHRQREYTWILNEICKGDGLKYEVHTEGGNISSGTLNSPSENYPLPHELVGLIEEALTICNRFSVDTRSVVVSIEQLIRDKNRIKDLSLLYDADAETLEVKSSNQDEVSFEKQALVCTPTAMIGDHLFGLICVFFIEKTDSGFIKSKEIHRTYCGLYEEVKDAPMKNDIQEYKESLITRGFHVQFIQNEP